MTNSSSLASDSYRSIKALSKGVYKDKGSKFLSFAYPVESEEEVKQILQQIKKEYFDARHHCYAYRIGRQGDVWRANDDGEPSSTAGRPILGQIDSFGLSDILIVVVRYFGGILLGTGGLTVAYRSAAADALSNGEVVEKIAADTYTIRFGYLEMNDVMKALKELKISPQSPEYGNTCQMDVRVRLSQKDRFMEMLKNIDICPKV